MSDDPSKFYEVSRENGTQWGWAHVITVEHINRSIEVLIKAGHMYATLIELRALARNLLQIADYVEKNNTEMSFEDAKGLILITLMISFREATLYGVIKKGKHILQAMSL
jgi:hypothetical protein